MDCTTYEAIHKMRPGHDFAIIDEGHSLGAFPKASLRTRRLRERFYSVPMLFLSGTPTPESHSQIFHQLWISQASPFRHKNFYRWADEYVIKKERQLNGFTFIDYSGAIAEKVLPVIEPYFVTYTQEQAGFVCPIEESCIEVIEPVIPAMVRSIYKDRIITLGDGKVILADSPAKLMSKMRQISSGSCITECGEAVVISKVKADEIRRIFSGKKIALFYEFVAERKILSEVFGEDQLTEIPEQFQDNPSLTFVGQSVSSREGVALHNAEAIVFYTTGYSALTYFQARARLQALNRTAPAKVYYVFVKGGIERKVYDCVRGKRDFTYGYFVRKVAREL
jgi:hypothetical protein